MQPEDETLDNTLAALRDHVAAEPSAITPATDLAMNSQTLPTRPVIDTRVLPEPVDPDTFDDGIPVLSDMVVAGDPAARDRHATQQLPPDQIDEGLRLVVSREAEPDMDAPASAERPPAADVVPDVAAQRLPVEDSIDLTLDQDLVDEFVNSIETGINQHITRLLQERLTETIDAVALGVRDDIRTLVRGYIDTYLPELLAKRAHDLDH